MNIDCTNGYALAWVTDKLKMNIDELLVPSDNTNSISAKLLNDLRDGLIYESILDDCDNSQYLTNIEIVDNRSNGLRPLTDVQEWHDADRTCQSTCSKWLTWC